MTLARLPVSEIGAALAGRASFKKLKREGSSFHGKFMVLSVLKAFLTSDRASALSPRAGVGGAVVRNRVRRRLARDCAQ